MPTGFCDHPRTDLQRGPGFEKFDYWFCGAYHFIADKVEGILLGNFSFVHYLSKVN